MITPLTDAWHSLLPAAPELGTELIERWSEPHRTYHSLPHLTHALISLRLLGSGSLTEQLAVWFHDAVFTGTPGADEEASAQLAADRLQISGLPSAAVNEIVRLILVTIDHSPAASDLPGARVSDADFAILGSTPPHYLASVAALRAESPGYDDQVWRTARRERVEALLARDFLFHTTYGRATWADPARLNLNAELAELTLGAVR